jgi:hypothetical protein
MKLLYLGIQNVSKKWTMPVRNLVLYYFTVGYIFSKETFCFTKPHLLVLKGGLINIWRCRIRGCSTQKVLLKVTDTEF